MQGNPTPTPQSIGAQPSNAKLDALVGLPVTDGNIIVGNGTTWVAESGATARASLGITDPSEGTWSVSYLFSTSGSCTMDPTTFGRYRLDGDWVEFWLRAATSTISSPSGRVRINLPFAASMDNFWPIGGVFAYDWESTLTEPLFALINTADFIALYRQIPSITSRHLMANFMSASSSSNHVFIAGKYKKA